MTRPRDATSPDRRRFLMLMGLACAASALPGTAAAIDAAPPSKAAASAPPATPGADTKPPSAEARALVDVLRIRYGSELTEAKLGAIAEDLDGRLEGGRALRKLALENGDEPDFTFHV